MPPAVRLVMQARRRSFFEGGVLEESLKFGASRARSLARIGLALLIVVLGAADAPAQTSAIVLTVRHGPGPLDVTLEWTGGSAPYEIFRSIDMKDVCQPQNTLAITDVRTWADLAPPAGFVYYRVHSAGAAEPTETCNGGDDDCDGLIDDNTTTCNAAACEVCNGGACRSKCGPCDTCVNGTCQSRCGTCESCQNGVCGP